MRQRMSMDWDKLKVFHAAAEAGSFTQAGEQLGLSQSAVSRQVSALEQELGVSLFHRHARGLILTEQGELVRGLPVRLALLREGAQCELQLDDRALFFPTDAALASWMAQAHEQRAEIVFD